MSLPNPAELIRQMASTFAPTWPAVISEPRYIGIRTGGVWVAQALLKELGDRAPGHPGRFLLPRRLQPERPAPASAPVGPAVRDRRPAPGADRRRADERPHHPRRLNELFDYGRPASVTLVCLLDLDAGELPIRPNVVGATLSLAAHERVKLTGPAPLALERQDLASASAL
jgi:pyrimidine operon attenuation protein/uracil phosphoribosyltransferase